MPYLKLAVALLSMTAGTAVYAQNDFSAQLKARQGQMRIMAINLGILGGMARGNIEYNAEAAQAAADSLAGVAMINQAPLWPEGSGEDAIDGTIALPAIWENWEGFAKNWATFQAGAAAMQAGAAGGQSALGPLMGGIGGACQACHEQFQRPRN